MNGISLQVAGAQFAKVLTSLTLPAREGLVYEALYGKDIAKSGRNIASRSVPGSVSAGAPTFNATSVVTSSGAAGTGPHVIDTAVPVGLPNDVTMIMVRRKPTAGSAGMVLGVANSGNTAFLGLIDHATNFLTFHNSQATTGRPSLPYPDPTGFFFVAASGSALGVGKIYTGSGGVLTSALGATAGLARFVPSTTTYKLSNNVFSNVQVESAYAAIFHRILTDQEVLDAYASLKAYLATLGVAVL